MLTTIRIKQSLNKENLYIYAQNLEKICNEINNLTVLKEVKKYHFLLGKWYKFTSYGKIGARLKGTNMTIIQAAYDVSNVNITFSKTRVEVPFYGCHQQGNRRMTDSRDMFAMLTQSESWFFWNMDKAKDINTNEVVFTRANCPSGKANSYPKVIQSLINKHMLLRIKQNHYLISPHITMPKFKEYQKVLAKWNSLGGKLPPN